MRINQPVVELLYAEKKKYQELLATSIQKAADNSPLVKSVNKMKDLAQNPHLVQIIKDESLNCLQLAWPSEDDQEMEEVVLSAQGYIIGLDLPPIYTRKQLSSKIIHSAQSVVITGLGTSQFEEYIQAHLAIHHVLARHLPKDTLLHVKPRLENEDFTLSVHNRYYTPQYNGEDEILEFGEAMDPLGCLMLNKPHNSEYTEDNKVQYFEQHTDDSGGNDFVSIPPNMISAGDLVELQFTIRAYSTTGRKHKMVYQLRAITVLDRSVEQQIISGKVQSLKESNLKQKIKKRKVGHHNVIDELEYRRKKAKLTTVGEGSCSNGRQGEAEEDVTMASES